MERKQKRVQRRAISILLLTACLLLAAAVLAVGDAADRTDIIYLEKIPLFFHNKK